MSKTTLVNIEIPRGKVCDYNIVTVAKSPLYLRVMCGKHTSFLLTNIICTVCVMSMYSICSQIMSDLANGKFIHPSEFYVSSKNQNFHNERNLLMKSNLMNFRVNFNNFNVIEG